MITHFGAKFKATFRARVHGDFYAKFVEYALKIQRNAVLLNRASTTTTDGAEIMHEMTNPMRFFNLESVLILSHHNFMHMKIY